MFASHQGELAALATVLCWSLTALSFEAAGKRVGSLSVNIIRLVFAMVLLSVFNSFYRGSALPLDASGTQWFWLGLLGVVGFTVGDLCFFRALVLIGSRRASLVMLTLAPPMAALIGWAVLGKRLGWLELFGMTLTLAGIAWVILEKKGNSTGEPENLFGGVALAVIGAVGQAGGAVISKLGMIGMDPAGATQIRIVAGIAGFAVMFTVIGWWPKVFAAFRHRQAMGFITIGSVFGPFLGVTLFQAALKLTEAGIAQTIAALVPVVIIPFSVMFFKERVNLRAVLGAVVAVGGVALLFLR
ncbi:MAG: DMT family transporter [Planctomycetota bacterium]